PHHTQGKAKALRPRTPQAVTPCGYAAHIRAIAAPGQFNGMADGCSAQQQRAVGAARQGNTGKDQRQLALYPGKYCPHYATPLFATSLHGDLPYAFTERTCTAYSRIR